MARVRVVWVLAAFIAGSAALLYLGRASRTAPPVAAQGAPQRTMVLATTTSVQDSGLLDELLPRFEGRTGIHARVLAVGSGKAVELGRLGEADAVLCHSPKLEEEFVRDGLAESRKPVARNEFMVVGPASDPAAVRKARTGAEALKRIAAVQAPFISRGDGSGTHRKEQDLWKAAGIEPKGAWYERLDAGMGATLRRADERGAYTLADGATFTAYRERLKLQPLHRGSAGLENPYSVLVVAPGRRPAAGVEDARQFSRFLTGPEGQGLIAGYGLKSYGRALFLPAAR
jgi:tungstate transport system substrate-binding protein